MVSVVLAAGAPLVQVRAKGGYDRDRLEHTRQIVARCAESGAVSIVNDRADLALAAGADGVHVGSHDVPVDVARRLVGDRAIVGATCRNPAQARVAVARGASYLGVGPVFVTATKTGLPDPIGVDGVAAVVGAVDVPVIAIAGVRVGFVAEVVAAGAHGVAVVGAVFDEDDPARATKAFLEALG